MEQLIDEIHDLRKEVVGLRDDINDRNRATRNRMFVTVLVLIVLAFASWKAIDISRDAAALSEKADENSRAVELLVEENRVLIDEAEADRAEVALLACQNRNSGQQSIRAAFESVWLLIEAANPSPRTQEFVDDARAELAATPDRDCNGDGIIDTRDYLTENSASTEG